jgi:hypothetical protein
MLVVWCDGCRGIVIDSILILCGYVIDIIDTAHVGVHSIELYRHTRRVLLDRPDRECYQGVPIAPSEYADRKWSFCVTFRSLSGDRAEQNQIFSPR